MLIVQKTLREGDAVQNKLLTFSFKASLLAVALAVLPPAAGAAGLGKITVLSALGQPLRAEVELTATREELSSISARLASHEAFNQAGIEFVPALAGVKLAVDKRPSGQPVIRMTTDRPVNEPFLDLLIELNWASGRLVREYTFLLDPAPEVLAQKPTTAPPAAQPEPAVVAQPAPAPKAPEPRAVAPMDEQALAKKPAAPKPVAQAKTVEVKRGDTLGKIAAVAKPEGVSLDQMLVALFRANQDAFIGNNLHRLKAGKILAIPERDAVAAVGEGDAKRVIAAQTADFNAYRKKLAEAAAAAPAPKEAAAQQEATGKITAKVEDKVPAEAKDQLKVSKAEAGKAAQAVQGKIAALEEDIVAKDKALKEAQSRQAALEKNVKELQKLVELKNQGLAEMQKQAAAKPAPAAAATKPEPAPAPAPEAAKPAAPAVAEKPADKPADVAPAKPAEAEKVVEAAKPPKPEPPQVAPPEEPGFLDELVDNPAVLGGGVLALGLLGLLAYRQSRKRKHEGGLVAPTTAASLASNSVFGATGGQSVDTSASSAGADFSQASIGAIDADEGVDPVAEADVYMAYGRDAQAEEILLDALKSDPTRTAIHVKLLEIYAARKNAKQFETLASDLYAQTGGVGADWEKAAAMGQKLDPANPLYGGAAARQASVSTDATIIVPAAENLFRESWTVPGEAGPVAETVEEAAPAASADQPAVAAAQPEAAPAPLDFDLDLGAPPAPAAQAEAKAPEPPALDFDLGLDFQPAAETPDFTPEPAVEAAKVEPAPPPLAFDLKLEEEPKPEAEPAPIGALAGVASLHFDLDLGASAPEAPVAEVIDPDKGTAGDNALDFDLDLGTAPAEPARPAEPSVDLAAISLDLGEPAAVSAGGDEAATKLELAKAYEEMGDKEGARELLQEVLQEGSAEQQAKARGMLDKLG